MPSTHTSPQGMKEPVLAIVIPPDHPPQDILSAAREAEDAGVEEVWLWEDCFATSGLAPAAAILGATGLRVGLGLMPVPLRNPALATMEVATLAAMFPGRFLPGFGHGILGWMGQAGARVRSPLTLLREHLGAVRGLLAGEELSVQGRYVVLDRVALRWPPAQVPPLLVGGRGPRTLALAGELGDGLILDDVAPEGRADPDRLREVLEVVRAARAQAGREGPLEVVAFLPTVADVTVEDLRREVGALAAAGATRVAVVAGGVDGPPAGGGRIGELARLLGRAALSP